MGNETLRPSASEHEPCVVSKAVLFMGVEGSGKSTQAQLAAQKLRIPYISSGDLVRETAETDATEIGEKARAILATNSYMDMDTFQQIITKRLKQQDTENGFVLEGFPRSKEQAAGFAQVLTNSGKEDMPVHVVFLRIPVWEAAQRLQSRIAHDPRNGETIDGDIKRMGHFFKGLPHQSSYVKNESGWKFNQISAHNRKVEEISQEVIQLISA